jgi:hypothetical protein
MAFKQAERTQLYLRCALFGPSGSGKTMTALRMAKGIADKLGTGFAVIDTEARSASKYADRFTFAVDDLREKTIERYLASMRDCVQAGYHVLVIDSLSHAWRELTDEVDRITQKSTSHNSFQAWGQVNPKQKALIDAILNFPGHIIATMRSKTEWVISENRNGKLAPTKMGLAPEQGKGIEYEFDLLVELNQNHQAVVTKDRTGKFQDELIDKPGEDFGATLYGWLTAENGNGIPPTVIETGKSDTAEVVEITATTETVQDEPLQRPQAAKPPDVKAEGAAVIKAIGDILNAVDGAGERYFNEDEKTDAHQIVTSVKVNEAGLKELRSFRDFLSGELTKRENNRKAA